MEQLFNIDLKKYLASQKRVRRKKKNLNLFLEGGLPNKKDEDWKFTDFNAIIKKILKILLIITNLLLIKK